MNKLFLALMLSLAAIFPAAAAIDTYEFESKADQERFRSLTEELRCPKCQNQNIADSDAEISLDMRELTYRMMIDEGKTNDEIVGYLVERYGDFVRYKPPVDKRTLLLWYGPFALLAFALLILVVIVARRRKAVKALGKNELSAAEQQRIQQLIEQTRENK
ncbi:MAG: cytochrome c-type biogenesis protein CcmH [Thiopseudomonas sp.]|nr:cytochrome c-type biogenesis protein CcmH [Thiopseudomonas sp.]MCK9466297.1 cytochrome c-type biogenesis protein CcmH [Thiopseudomonas sp.]